MVVDSVLPYAEDCNYFKTSQSGADDWLDRAGKLIEDFGGTVLRSAYGFEAQDGRAAYMLEFMLFDDTFRSVFPVLPTRIKGHERAARVQAVTILYHDIKAKIMTAQILGTRSAFFSYLVLPSGQTAAMVSMPELMRNIPLMLGGGE